MSTLPSLAGLSLSKQNEVTTEMWPFDTYTTKNLDKVSENEETLQSRYPHQFETAVAKLRNKTDVMEILDELMDACSNANHKCTPEDWAYALIQWLGSEQYEAIDEIGKTYIGRKSDNIVEKAFASFFGLEKRDDPIWAESNRNRNWKEEPWNGEDNFHIFRMTIHDIYHAFAWNDSISLMHGFYEPPYSKEIVKFSPKKATYGVVLFMSKLETVFNYYMESVHEWAVKREYCLANVNELSLGDNAEKSPEYEEEDAASRKYGPKYDEKKIDYVPINTVAFSRGDKAEEFDYHKRTFYGRFFTPWGLAMEVPISSLAVWLGPGLIRMEQIKDARDILQPTLDKWFAMRIAFENASEFLRTGERSDYPMEIDDFDFSGKNAIKSYEKCAAAFKPFEEYFTHKEHGQPARVLPNRHEQRIQKSEIDTKLFLGHTGIDESFVQTFIAGVPLTFCQFNRRFFDQALMTFNNLRARARLSHDSLNEFKYDFATTMFLWNDVMGIYTPPPTQV